MSDLKDSVKSLLEGLEGFASSKLVVGQPFKVNDCTIFPLNDVQIGVGVTGTKRDTRGGGMGAKMSPSAVLIIQNDGAAKIINIKNQDSFSRVLDMIPEVVDKVTGKKVRKDEKVDAAVDDIKKKAEE
ncbi:MAG: GerW family sporulation protein [Lachnospiraceae bacterium]|nr:GerW family sporulation protein [Lachnospiraceae bacterium]MBP5254357.1 GerW family sporulation protein [Lachnospiraceae bacterium]